jgi:hypothetical protein
VAFTFLQIDSGQSSEKAPPHSDPNRTRELIAAAARREFAVLLRSIVKWLLLIVAALLIVMDSCDEVSRVLESEKSVNSRISRSISPFASEGTPFRQNFLSIGHERVAGTHFA